MPGMNATGTNTAQSTSTIATSAPPTSSIDFRAASLGERPSFDMLCSTLSITTIASSTTMPMASTMPNSVSMLIEKPSAVMPIAVPMIEIGTAMMGISVARMLCRNRNTTRTTSTSASKNVWTTVSIECARELRRVHRDVVFDAFRERLLQLGERGDHVPSTRRAALAPGCW